MSTVDRDAIEELRRAIMALRSTRVITVYENWLDVAIDRGEVLDLLDELETPADRADVTWEYVVVYDGDPYMDGTHERRELGTYCSLERAREAFRTSVSLARFSIERRLVSQWEVIDDGTQRG